MAGLSRREVKTRVIEHLRKWLPEENLGLIQTEGRGPLASNFAESGGFFRTSDDAGSPRACAH